MNQKKGRYSIALVIFLMIPLAVLQGCVLRQQQVQEKGTQAAQKPSQGQQAPSSPPLTAEEGVVQKEKPAVEQQQKEPTIEQPAEIPSSESLIVGTVRPAPTTTAVRQPTTKEGETERPVKFSRQYELETLTLDSYKLERISRDKGEVTEVTFTVRNTGNKKLSPQVTLWFKTQEADSIQGMQEKTYDLPALEPGYKVTKTYPVVLRFHYLDKPKSFILRLREKFISPSPDLVRIEKTFVPEEEMEGLSVSWT